MKLSLKIFTLEHRPELESKGLVFQCNEYNLRLKANLVLHQALLAPRQNCFGLYSSLLIEHEVHLHRKRKPDYSQNHYHKKKNVRSPKRGGRKKIFEFVEKVFKVQSPSIFFLN